MKRKAYKESFKLENGVKLYKEDFLELKKLLKYESDLENEKSLKIYFFYFKPDIPIRLSADLENINVGLENSDIDYLHIQKTITEKGSLIKSVNIVISRNSAEVDLVSDDKSWMDFERDLLERFFARRKSKLGKYNRWIINRLHWYSSILAGILGGIGIGLENKTMIIAALLTFVISAIVTYPKLTHKLFPLNEFSFSSESIRELIEKKESSFPKWLKDGATAVFWGIVTYLLIKYTGL